MNGRPWRSWRLATALGKTRWFCWADLVSWVMEPAGRTEKRLTDCRGVRSCRAEAETIGVCYCGTFRTPAAHKQMGYPAGRSWQIVTPAAGTPAMPRDDVDDLIDVTDRRARRIRAGMRWALLVAAATVIGLFLLGLAGCGS